MTDIAQALLWLAGPASGLLPLLAKSLFLSLAALGAGISMKAGGINLGLDGAIPLGALAGWCCVSGLESLARGFAPAFLGHSAANPLFVSCVWMLALAMAAFSGALFAFVPARLKRSLGIDSLITSYFLAQAFMPLFSWLVSSVIRNRESALVATASLRARPGAFAFASFALALVAFAVFFMYRSVTGLETGLAGSSRAFALNIGIDVKAREERAFVVGGAFAALAGALLLSLYRYRIPSGFASGLGWMALTCAIVSKGRLPIILPVSVFFAWLDQRAQAAQLVFAAGPELGMAAQAILIFIASAGREKRR